MLSRVILLALTILVSSTAAAAITTSEWKFQEGHDPSWSQADFDDSNWRQIQVPGFWSNQGINAYFGQGWYRTYFSLPAISDVDSYVYLGRIYSTDELFINGVSIGAYGQFPPNLIEAHVVVRLYQIPASLLQAGRNTLALRVQSSFPAAGLVHDIVKIGTYSELVDHKMMKVQRMRDYEGISISFFLFTCFFALFLMLNKQGFIQFWALFMYLVVMLSITILSSTWFYETGMKSSYVQRLIFALCALGTILLHRIIMSLVSQPYSLYDKFVLLAVSSFTLWLVSPLWPGFSPVLIAMSWLMPSIMLFWTFARGIRPIAANITKLDISSYLCAIAIIFPVIGIVLEVLAVPLIDDFSPLSGSLLVSTTFLLLQAARRYVELTNRIYTLNQRVYLVQDMERARIARDLHDQVGQRLVTLKLRAQMLLVPHTSRDKDELIDNIDTCINNIREVLSGLKPSELTKGLIQAISVEAKKITKNSGIEVQLDLDDSLNFLDVNKAENLYLICLEAMNNVVKHAQAQRIVICLRKKEHSFYMSVYDNGKGFLAGERVTGMGFDSMRERAGMLDTKLMIDSELGKGTKVELVPD